MPLLQNAEFVRSVAALHDLPDDSLCEVAFAGRSNSGKSSAINALANRSRLAFVSKMPGRTQQLNFFRLAAGKYLVDLPGYGFAQAPGGVRASWEGLLAPYLQQRSALAGLLLIMDCRHALTDLDRRLLDWFLPVGKPVHVLLSKADKLSSQQQALTLRAVEKALQGYQHGASGSCSAQLFSSLRKKGIAQAEAVLAQWLHLAASGATRREASGSGLLTTVEKKPPARGWPGAHVP